MPARARVPLSERSTVFAVMCAVLLAVFNQLSGINVIMYYAADDLPAAGASADASMLQAVAVGATNMVFTIVAMFFIDRLGRKTLLLTGAVGMRFRWRALGCTTCAGLDDAPGRLFVVAHRVFAFSQGAVIWVFPRWIFPNKVRAKARRWAPSPTGS